MAHLPDVDNKRKRSIDGNSPMGYHSSQPPQQGMYPADLSVSQLKCRFISQSLFAC